MDASDRQPGAERSRLITTLGWINLILGIGIPLRAGIETLYYWKRLNLYYFRDGFLGLDSQVPHSIVMTVELTSILVIGGMSVWAGCGLIRRSPRAPLATAVAAGFGVTDALYFLLVRFPRLHGPAILNNLLGYGPGFPRAQSDEMMWRIVVTCLLNGILLMFWMSTLPFFLFGAKLLEFPLDRPPLTAYRLRLSLVVSIVVWALVEIFRHALWIGLMTPLT